MGTARKQTLDALISFSEPIELIESRLSALRWDSGQEIAMLSVDHIVAVLKRFLTGTITDSEVERWANAIECRDDIGLPANDRGRVRALIYELANPVLTQPLTRERAIELLATSSN